MNNDVGGGEDVPVDASSSIAKKGFSFGGLVLPSSPSAMS
jgi:hypothetical protein